MKRTIYLAGLVSVSLLSTLSAADPAKAQSDQQVIRLAKEIQAQQAAISENQAKIDAKIAAVAEEVRQARIYASRGR